MALLVVGQLQNGLQNIFVAGHDKQFFEPVANLLRDLCQERSLGLKSTMGGKV
ncbi:hypothetical protein ACO0K9_17885 [Undibacterium sp. Ji50W]|uniref:hypothetical protein n=1 Tax=Undibacterium sp. Ji50W TaxID=3413041 RepID=UPI003BF3F15F